MPDLLSDGTRNLMLVYSVPRRFNAKFCLVQERRRIYFKTLSACRGAPAKLVLKLQMLSASFSLWMLCAVMSIWEHFALKM